ncbi:hypothetical protein MNBD_GAMMA12-241 [hydrothermal vent metagenome]|uniref:Uncharacterized protein n=1 Tax=hydrothermal vent metagenome TaxID=652676 RepID=A0A3B0YBZ0_9ZZZZ
MKYLMIKSMVIVVSTLLTSIAGASPLKSSHHSGHMVGASGIKANVGSTRRRCSARCQARQKRRIKRAECRLRGGRTIRGGGCLTTRTLPGIN